MSVPAPLTVNTLLEYPADPASAGDPTSPSVHGDGSGPGGGGATEPDTDTLSKAAVLTWPMSCPVSNSPMSTGPVMDTVWMPIWVQVAPLAHSYAVNGLPALVSFSHLLGEVKPARFGPVEEWEPEVCSRTPLPTDGVIAGSGLRHPLALQPTPLMLGVFGLTSAVTSASPKGAPFAVDCRIISPALAHGSESVWYLTRAMMVPSPCSPWQTTCDWSLPPSSSAPP